MAGIIKQQSRQQLIRLVAHCGAVGPLGERFLSDCLKQRVIHDRWLLDQSRSFCARYALGVVPTALRKARLKFACDENPVA
jgi:hypothetical protein